MTTPTLRPTDEQLNAGAQALAYAFYNEFPALTEDFTPEELRKVVQIVLEAVAHPEAVDMSTGESQKVRQAINRLHRHDLTT
jgi:lysylphosphatidylglycerol synthetase-like protein (DUF2156 family)